MKLNIFLKIILAIIIAVTGMVEVAYVFVLPIMLTKYAKKQETINTINKKTNLNVSFKDIKIRTNPKFDIFVTVDDLKISSQLNKEFFKADSVSASINLPSLALKKLNLNYVDSKNLQLELSRKKDGNFYVGEYKLDKNLVNKTNNIDISLNKFKSDIRNVDLKFSDEIFKKNIDVRINELVVKQYKKDKVLDFYLNSESTINGKNSKIELKFFSKLPLLKGLDDKKFNIDGIIKNVDLRDFSPYVSNSLNSEIKEISGLINTEFTTDKDIVIDSSLKNFSVIMKNPLDSIKADSNINLHSVLSVKGKNLDIKYLKINGKNWNIDVSGLIKDIKAKSPELDLKANIPNSNIHSMYHLLPSIPGVPNNVMQHFKKYGAWGNLNANLEIKGKAELPDIYGQAILNDVYIVKNNPIVPHCKITADFNKDKVHVKTRVFAGYGEYVDVEGTAEMKIYGAGDFHISSSKNVDLDTAEYMLVPVHKVVGFQLGPVPYMQIEGKGWIDLYTKGTILDGEASGEFHFKETHATLEGLNTKLENAEGKLVFNKKDMHFVTDKAFIKNQPLKIDGKANLDGKIDFNISTSKIDLSELFNILITSKITEKQKPMVAPIEKLSGAAETNIRIQGIAKTYEEIIEDTSRLKISGSIKLKNAIAKIKYAPISIHKLNGILSFENNDWKANIIGSIGSSKVTITGVSKNDNADVKINTQSIKTDELLQILGKENGFNFTNLPKTNSQVTFKAEYKASLEDFDFNKIKAEGHFIPPENLNLPFIISSGYFNIDKGNIIFKKFKAHLYQTRFHANGKIENAFSEKPLYTYDLNISNFDLKLLNRIKNQKFVPQTLKKVLKAYENYSGNINANISSKKNKIYGIISLKNIKLTQAYFKTPISVDTGTIKLNGNKIILKSFIANVDNTPVYIDLSAWDLDKTLKFEGYMTSKVTEHFVNSYINSFLSYPLKIKGDVSLKTSFDGTLEKIRIKPSIKLAQDADIYYMSGNLGDTDVDREINSDIEITGNTYDIKNIEYVRFLTSQNNKTYPSPVIKIKGKIKRVKNNLFFKNLKIETINSANAKPFNVAFKKSIIKSGMYNCNLTVNGSLNTPIITGNAKLRDIEMPLYNAIIKDAQIDFKGQHININTNFYAYDSDFNVSTNIQNTTKPPFVVNELKIHSNTIELDSLVDSITRIPTPNTTVKVEDNYTKTKQKELNIADIQIKKGEMTADKIYIKGLPATNFISSFKLDKDLVLKINEIAFNITTGKVHGTASYNFPTGKIKAYMNAKDVDSNKVASNLLGMKDQIYGKSTGTLVMTTSGKTEVERIKNLSGYLYFKINNGKMPKLGSVEYLLKAGNFVKSGITGLSISNLVDLFSPMNTGYFDIIKGSLSLKNGVVQNIEVYSKGENLNMFINGEYDILQNYANMRVFGRLTKHADSILGKVGNLSLNSILNSLPGFKLSKNDKLQIINELNKIPGVELSNEHYRIFTVKIDGKLNDGKFVKSFRWIE